MDARDGYVLTFIAGILAGFVLRLITARREREKHERDAVYNARRLFRRFVMMAPSFVEQMQRDLARPECTRCRHFMILPSHHGQAPTLRDILIFFDTEHVDLRERVAFLEQVGFVQSVRRLPVPMFVMTEVFVALLWETNA